MITYYSIHDLRSLAIIYIVSAIFNWLAPSAMALMGLKITMIVGAATYVVFVAGFFIMDEIMLYSASALLGVGAAFIWTAQGAFLTVNSDSKTMARNSGIFWAMLQSSLLIGNTYYYFQFAGKDVRPESIQKILSQVQYQISGYHNQ